MNNLSVQTMRGFLRRITALQKQNAFEVEAFTVTPYYFKDSGTMTISCWVCRNEEDDSETFEIHNYLSIEENERTMDDLEAYLNAI